MAVVSIVVVPAHDEQQTIVACLEVLASQTIPADTFETIVVADACGDETAVVARAAAQRLGLLPSVMPGPGCGSVSPRLGMDAAADRLASLGAIDGLIATTDADSTPAADWLARQLDHIARGARVIAGLIELDRAGATLPTAVLRRREADAARRLAQLRQDEPDAAHHHFAGGAEGSWASPWPPIARRVDSSRRPPSRTRPSCPGCGALGCSDPARLRCGRPHLAAVRRSCPARLVRRSRRIRLGASAGATRPATSRWRNFGRPSVARP